MLTPDSRLRDRDISAVANQVDFYPFGQEFYVSAATVAPLDNAALIDWSRRNDTPAWSDFPHAELTEDIRGESGLEQLTRYFGAGFTIQTIDNWAVTMEGGAYFGDGSEDRMMMYDPETGEAMPLLEDLDKVGNEAIGERHARSVRPVAHLVLRRRF
ncbi:hypothetical protein [Maricaulis sp. CAU 1757]